MTIELDPDWVDLSIGDFIYLSGAAKDKNNGVFKIIRPEDRAVTMLALAMISAAWFFIGSAAGAMLMWWLG